MEIQYGRAMSTKHYQIFHLNCKHEDADYHAANFIRFINGYIEDELDKSMVDVLGQVYL